MAPNHKPLVAGKRVTGFANSEKAAVGLTEVVPFLVEDALEAAGGVYSKGPDWMSYVQVDGMLITGQNPASSRQAEDALLPICKFAPRQRARSSDRTHLDRPSGGTAYPVTILLIHALRGPSCFTDLPATGAE